MSEERNSPRLGVPIVMQRIFQSNVVLLAGSNDEALKLLHRLHEDASPGQASDMTVDDVSYGQPVYFFDLDRPNITVGGYALRCQCFGLGDAGHPGLPMVLKRSHLFIATQGQQEELMSRLVEEQRGQVFVEGPSSIEDTLEEALGYLIEHASIE